MEAVKAQSITPDRSPVVGLSMVANDKVSFYQPALISDGEVEIKVPMQFFTGDLSSVRAQFHKYVDDFMDQLPNC